MSFEKKSGIYLITNKVNGNRYVGCSSDLRRRKWEHFAPSRANDKMFISMAIAKHGKDNFNWEILEYCPIKKLSNREIYWIAKLKPEYNSTSGGDGNPRPVSEKTRTILSQKGKEYWRGLSKERQQYIINNQLIGPRIGHPVSKETREKLRQANLGKQLSEEHKRKISEGIKRSLKDKPRYNEHHRKPVILVETGQIFESVKAAGEYLGVNPSNISAVAKGKQKTVKGYTFKYHNKCRD